MDERPHPLDDRRTFADQMASSSEGRRNGGYERGTVERTLPIPGVLLSGDQANVFDGTEASFPATAG